MGSPSVAEVEIVGNHLLVVQLDFSKFSKWVQHSLAFQEKAMSLGFARAARVGNKMYNYTTMYIYNYIYLYLCVCVCHIRVLRRYNYVYPYAHYAMFTCPLPTQCGKYARFRVLFLDQAVRRAHLLYLLMDAPSRTPVLELWLPMWRVKQGPALAMYHSATRVVQCPPGEGAAGAQISIPRFTVHLYLAEGANIAGLKPFFTLQINLKGHHASP